MAFTDVSLDALSAFSKACERAAVVTREYTQGNPAPAVNLTRFTAEEVSTAIQEVVDAGAVIQQDLDTEGGDEESN